VRFVFVVVFIEAIPIGALISAALDRSLRRRSDFWLRVAAVALAMLLPALVAVFAPVGENAAVTLFWAGFGWGLLLSALSRFVLFYGCDYGPGSAEDDGDGPGPEDDRPTPPAPIGGIPLPDARPSAARLRDHLPAPAGRPRRPVRERERRVPHVRPLRFWPRQRPI
jgi:hypothetical protein